MNLRSKLKNSSDEYNRTLVSCIGDDDEDDEQSMDETLHEEEPANVPSEEDNDSEVWLVSYFS